MVTKKQVLDVLHRESRKLVRNEMAILGKRKADNGQFWQKEKNKIFQIDQHSVASKGLEQQKELPNLEAWDN